jgi:shikimate kinase / 3-dehydroquinate synthase
MGSGKSTLAQALAAKLGTSAFDLDALIERAAGTTVESIFRERGEAGFRELERETLHAELERHTQGVFALGGGTVTDQALRRELLAGGTLVTLSADVSELARRVGEGKGRPLLAGHDVEARLEALLAQRADAYAECHARIQTGGRALDAIADEVIAVARDQALVVPLGTRSYRVEIGAGVRARLPLRAGKRSRVVLVSDELVAPLFGDALAEAMRAAGTPVETVVLGPGEAHKNIASVERIWEAALSAEIDRGGLLIGVGGGVVGDLTGFAAATLLRGVAVGHVPTTLLAMVDSAIGGKTGFDTRHGKNLVGAFHQPSFVLCDVETLATLPDAERRAGLGEVVKAAFIDGEAAVQRLERDAAALRAGDAEATVRAIRMAAALKARVVTEDEREAGLRAVLNLGHTLGHAIEAAQGYTGLRHGEAVALGMVAAFGLSARLGIGTAEQQARLVRLLDALGLPTNVGAYMRPEVLSFIASDKKRMADSVTFVLPAEPGRIVLRPLAIAELPALLQHQ